MNIVSKEEFEKAFERLKEFKILVGQFANKEDCIEYLMEESNLSRAECEQAYEFYSKLDLSDEYIQLAKSNL